MDTASRNALNADFITVAKPDHLGGQQRLASMARTMLKSGAANVAALAIRQRHRMVLTVVAQDLSLAGEANITLTATSTAISTVTQGGGA